MSSLVIAAIPREDDRVCVLAYLVAQEGAAMGTCECSSLELCELFKE